MAQSGRVWFGKSERELIARGFFTSVHDLARKIKRYLNTYSTESSKIVH